MANKRLQKVELLKVTREIQGRRKNLDTETQDNGKQMKKCFLRRKVKLLSKSGNVLMLTYRENYTLSFDYFDDDFQTRRMETKK